MKKSIILLSSLFVLSLVACNNKEEPKTEEVSMETAVEQMTEALDTTNAVAPVADSAATK